MPRVLHLGFACIVCISVRIIVNDGIFPRRLVLSERKVGDEACDVFTG